MPIPFIDCEFTIDGTTVKGIHALHEHLLKNEVKGLRLPMRTPEQSELDAQRSVKFGYENPAQAVASVEKRTGSKYPELSRVPDEDLQYASESRKITPVEGEIPKDRVKEIADNLRKAASFVRRPLAEGIQSDITALPREVVALALEGVAKGIEAGDALAGLVKKAVEGIHRSQDPNQVTLSKREIEAIFRKRLAASGIITPERKVKKSEIMRMVRPEPSEKIEMSEAEGLKKQLKDFARGYKEGLKSGELGGEISGKRQGIKEGVTEEKARQKEVYNQVSNLLKTAESSGTLPGSVVKKLLRMAAGIGSDPLKVEAFQKEFDTEVNKANSKESLDVLKNFQRKIGSRPDEGTHLPSEQEPVPSEEKKQAKAKNRYNAFGKIKDVWVRNLNQLKSFSEDIADLDPYRAVIKYATSSAESKIMLRSATQSILDKVGKDGWDKLRGSLLASRLQGVQERWLDMSENVLKLTNQELEQAISKGGENSFYEIVSNLKGLGEEKDPAKEVVNLVSNGYHDIARSYLSDLFDAAAERVPKMDFPSEIKDSKFTDPKMQEALESYQKFIAGPLAESHAKNEGVFSEDLGPLNTYYPMIPTGSDEYFHAASAGTYGPIKNKSNIFTTGQAKNYSTEIEDFAMSLGYAVKSNNKTEAVKLLRGAGLIRDTLPTDGKDVQIEVGGEVYEGVRVPEGMFQNVVMPKWLYRELAPIFERDIQSMRDVDFKNQFGKVVDPLVKLQLGGIIEPSAHSFRLLGSMMTMPFMQEWAYKKGVIGYAGGLVLNNPLTKVFFALGKTLGTDISSEEGLSLVKEMSEKGLLPEKTFSKTGSQEFSELMAAKKVGKLDFSWWLYGKKGFDTKARVAMYRLTKAMNPEATPEQHQRMQQQMGIYTRGMQGSLERWLKDTKLAPYASFGLTYIREGMKAALGLSNIPLDTPAMSELGTAKGLKQLGKYTVAKAAQLVTTGIVGSVAYWAATYNAIKGVYPWDDPTSKFLKLPIPDEVKDSELAKKLFYNEKNGQWDDVDMTFFNPLINRGARGFGVPKYYETKQLGGEEGQAEEAAFAQSVNTIVSPVANSPFSQFVMKSLTGNAPYMTSLRNDKGVMAPQFFRSVATQRSGLGQLGANLTEATLQVNPLIEGAANTFGLNPFKNSYDSRDEGAGHSVEMILDIMFPRLRSPHGNDPGKEFFLKKQREATEKSIEKEKGGTKKKSGGKISEAVIKRGGGRVSEAKIIRK